MAIPKYRAFLALLRYLTLSMARKAGWLYRSIGLFLLCFGILRSSWHVRQDGYTEVSSFSCFTSVFDALYGTHGRMVIPKYWAFLALLRYFALSMARKAGWLYRSIGLFLLCFGILHSLWHVRQDGYTEVSSFSCFTSVFDALYGTLGRMAIPKYWAFLALLRYLTLSMARRAGWLYRSIELSLLYFGI